MITDLLNKMLECNSITLNWKINLTEDQYRDLLVKIKELYRVEIILEHLKACKTLLDVNRIIMIEQNKCEHDWRIFYDDDGNEEQRICKICGIGY